MSDINKTLYKGIDKEELQKMFEDGFSQQALSSHYKKHPNVIRSILWAIYETTNVNQFKGKNKTEWHMQYNNKKTKKKPYRTVSLRPYLIMKKLLHTGDGYSDIAKTYSISRERVGQIADALCAAGFELHPRITTSTERRGRSKLTRGYVPREQREKTVVADKFLIDDTHDVPKDS